MRSFGKPISLIQICSASSSEPSGTDVEVDVGFRQASALVADLDATIDALGRFVPFDDALVTELADRVRSTGCKAVLCDISPLGIAVAERAGVPSLLVESFTWPWLYEPFFDDPAQIFAPYFPFGCNDYDQELWVIDADKERAATIYHETVPDDWPAEDWLSYDDWLGQYLPSAI